jgi:hypothetical protein
MFTGVIIAGTGTGKISPALSIGVYLYGIYAVITLILCLPMIGRCFPQLDDVAHGASFIPSIKDKESMSSAISRRLASVKGLKYQSFVRSCSSLLYRKEEYNRIDRVQVW